MEAAGEAGPGRRSGGGAHRAGQRQPGTHFCSRLAFRQAGGRPLHKPRRWPQLEPSRSTAQPLSLCAGAVALRPEDSGSGTLDGVYRSDDAGASWTLISPPGSVEIHEVESIAVNPANPDIIYAGTWHLPWRTTDGGKHWESSKQGVIEDSDVFSILVDR